MRYHTPSDGENAWPQRAPEAAQAIARSGAAIIGTQEGLLDMLKDLQEALPGCAWLGEGRQGGVAGEYNAIFYKTAEVQVVEQGQFWLSNTPETPGSQSWGSDCPRICTWARFRPLGHSQKEFLAFNTHLDHRSQEAREKGIAMILRALDTSRQALGCPAFLMGDFNSTPDNSVVTAAPT